MKKKYVYLFPDTFFFAGKNKMLLYNTANQHFIEIENDPFLTDLQEKLQRFENLYGTQIAEDTFFKYESLWKKLQKSAMGDIIECDSEDRPVSYPPILKLNHNIDSIRYDYEKGQAGYILNYLHEVTIYLSGNKNVQNFFYKQTIYPVSSPYKLSDRKLADWFGKMEGNEIKTINLLGEPTILNEYNDLYKNLSKKNIFINYYLRYKDFEQYKKIFSGGNFSENINIILLYEKNEIGRILPAYDSICLITDKQDLELMEKCLSGITTKEKKTEAIPIYTGNNMNFFRENVFTEKFDLLNRKITKKEIFLKSVLNSNFYGKLTILPDGEIYSNINYSALGNLEDSLYELLYKELDNGMSWRKLRDTEPCSQCRFKWLCPPVSNYEIVIGKSDLCILNENG